jgi:hypothetical protein
MAHPTASVNRADQRRRSEPDAVPITAMATSLRAWNLVMEAGWLEVQRV